MPKHADPPNLLPWYAHILGGWCVGGVFPWFLTIHQFYRRRRKKTAFFLTIFNLIFFISICIFGLLSHLSWYTLALIMMGVGLFWSFSAWLLQYSTFGKAPKRYYLKEWKNWFPPVISALLLGIGISVVLSTLPIIAERLQMYQARDLLTKNLILWDFFRYTPLSLLISLPIGLWWAGERDQFSPSYIVAYIFGLPLFYLIYSTASALGFFLLNQGNGAITTPVLSVLSHDLQGIEKFLIDMAKFDYSSMFVIPLLLGFTPRIRDFWRKSLVIFPLFSIIFISYIGYSHQFWQFYQGQIFYQMSSDNKEQQNRAYRQAQLLLDRFPDHQGWPQIAVELARHYYFNKDEAKAKDLYNTVLNKTKDVLQWTQQNELSAAVLKAELFGDQTQVFELLLPSIPYESYMTNNWMGLIRLMRFYEAEHFSESQTLIRLKSISKSDKKIKLSPMPTLAELDDNVANLGYDVFYLPAELSIIQKIIRSGYPVIQPVKHSFHLLFGLDDSRTVIESICYEDTFQVAEKLKKDKLAATVLRQHPDEKQPANSQSRIDRLARKEIPYSFWGSARQKDMASHVAVVFPKDKRNDIISLLDKSETELIRMSDSYLCSLIGLNALKSGDIVQAITWSYQSYLLDKTSFALHVSHLAKLLWQTRYQRIEHNLQLEKQLPHLLQIDDFLTREEVAAFLDKSSTSFTKDLHSNKGLPWMIRNQYKDFLDRSDSEDLQHLLTIAESSVYFEPYSRKQWQFLVEVSEWGNEISRIKRSYEGALQAGQWHDTLAIKLAYLHIRSDDFAKAQELLEKISVTKIKFNPDYYYCRAVVAQWQQDDTKAKEYYEKAIKMRRYDPNYHLDYAFFLQDRKLDPERVKKLLSWADRLSMASSAKPN